MNKEQEAEQRRMQNHARIINGPAHEQLKRAGVGQVQSNVSVTAPVIAQIKELPREDIGRLMARINDLESELNGVKNWKDPRNIPGRIDNLAESVSKVSTLANDLNNRLTIVEKNIKQLVLDYTELLKMATTPISEDKTEEIKNPVGRPKKDK